MLESSWIQEKAELKEQLKSQEQEIARLRVELEKKDTQLRSALITDTLTMAYNRYYFEQRAKEEFDRDNRYPFPLTLITFDLDGLSEVNKRFGQEVGDDVLSRISAEVKRHTRKPDVFARWGGEEFVILMPETNLGAGMCAAEKLRHEIEQVVHPIAGKVTASFGVAERKEKEDLDALLKRAEEALQLSKAGGRNMVTII